MKTKTQKRFENILLPIAKRLPVNPNLLTLVSVIFTFASAYYVLSSELAIAALFFAIGALLDALDGLTARAHRRETKLGAFYDQTADRINDGAVLIAIILAGYVNLAVGVSTLFLILTASYMSSVIDSLAKKRIGEKISFRPIRSAILFIGLLSGEIVAAVWLLLFIGLWTFFYRLFRARLVLN